MTMADDMSAARAGLFDVEIADEDFNLRTVRFDDQKVVGMQIAAMAEAHPIEDFAILQHLKSGELESIRPAEDIDLSKPGVERFFVVRGASNHRFTVEGLIMEWPQDAIAAKHIKFLARAGVDMVLVIDRDDGDRELNDDEMVDLSEPGVERFKLRKRQPKFVTIFVEATAHEWPKGEMITYEQVVTLEFPDFAQHPERTYSVTWKKGEGAKHEGVLVPGASVKVKDQMEFNVTDTGQS